LPHLAIHAPLANCSQKGGHARDATRSLPKLKTYLGRVIRDIERRIVGNEELRQAFVRPLFLARRYRLRCRAIGSVPCSSLANGRVSHSWFALRTADGV